MQIRSAPKGPLRLRGGSLVSAFGLAMLAMVGCSDNINLANSSSDARGVLVDGRLGGVDKNDQTFIANAATVKPGNFTTGASNEVIGFTNQRPVAIKTPATWTSGTDTVSLGFSNKIVLPVKVWIVKGPFNTQRQKAIDACIRTSAIWNSERMGLAFGPFEIVDATGDADAANYTTFTCAKQAGIQTDIGKTAGRINIYYVDTVDGGNGRGQACQIGSDFVAMGKSTGDELLSHELGHDFALTHIDDLAANFNQTNIMHSASSSRQFITEGQLFRAHLRSDSALNFLYSARPGQPTRNCDRDTASNACPLIRKRIWADGPFPAN